MMDKKKSNEKEKAKETKREMKISKNIGPMGRSGTKTTS